MHQDARLIEVIGAAGGAKVGLGEFHAQQDCLGPGARPSQPTLVDVAIDPRAALSPAPWLRCNASASAAEGRELKFGFQGLAAWNDRDGGPLR